jgi:DNA topoisomerase-3
VLAAAQSLYAERLMITYPRTKSRYLPESDHDNAIAVLHAISQNDPSKSPICNSANPALRLRAFNSLKLKDGKQAIAPLAVYHTVEGLTLAEQQVYDLIRNSYIAQFHPEAAYEKRHVEIAVGSDRFLADRKVLLRAGWRVCFPEMKEPDGVGALPVDLRPGDRPSCIEAATVAKKTEPPRHYTTATLLERMVNIDALVEEPALRKKLAETDGIGTDATRADIHRAGHREIPVHRTTRPLSVSTGRARAVCARLPPSLTRPALTATLEEFFRSTAASRCSRA